MSNPTSNFGWQMPTPTDLVTDLPADFEVFGQAVDTSLADLKGGTTGQILSKATNTDMDFVWITNDQGDITAVNVTSPITGGGTSGAVTVGIQSASTSQSGAVQLSDSTSTTSSVLAATSTAVKSAYDLANAAVPNTRTISTTSPLSGGGALSGNLTLAVGAGSTSTAGVLQLTDSTSSTSTTTAATPNSVKSAYDPAFTNNFYAGKNKFLNGDFKISQRGTSITIAATGYSLDRYNYAVASAVPTGTISQQTFTPGTAPVSGYEGSNFARINITANNGCTLLDFGNVIEDVRTLAGQIVTFSFWGKADASTTLGTVYVLQSFGSGGSASVTTNITLNSTTLGTGWARYTGTVTIPSISGKTVGTGSNLAIYMRMPTSAGVLRNGTYDFWGWQLENGSVATPFQTATGNPQAELAACQRYYWRSTATGVYSWFSQGFGISTTNILYPVQNPVPMRTAATSIDVGNLISYDGGFTGTGTVTIQANECSTLITRITYGGAGFTANRPYGLIANNNSAAYVGASAEL